MILRAKVSNKAEKMYWGGEPHTFHGAVSRGHTANVTFDGKLESGEVERRISEGRMFVPKGTTVGRFRSKVRMGRFGLDLSEESRDASVAGAE